VDIAWETRYPGIWLPLPPFCLLSVCNLPCKLSRYHVGTHSCGARDYPRRQSPNGLAAALLALVDMGSPSVVRPASKQRVGEEFHGSPAYD